MLLEKPAQPLRFMVDYLLQQVSGHAGDAPEQLQAAIDECAQSATPPAEPRRGKNEYFLAKIGSRERAVATSGTFRQHLAQHLAKSATSGTGSVG